jgi:hypothetical protein
MGFVFFSDKGRDETMLVEARKLSLFGNDLKAMDLMVEKIKMIVNKYIRRGKKESLCGDRAFTQILMQNPRSQLL